MFLHTQTILNQLLKIRKILSKKGTVIIEVQYLLKTIKDLTFDNIIMNIIITGLLLRSFF